MLNQVVLVGTINQLPVKDENNPRFSSMLVAVKKSDNEDDSLSDILEVVLWRGIADITSEKYKVGTAVGIKGRLQQADNNTARIIAERISFIST